MFDKEIILPLTLNELLELTTAVPDNKLNCDDEIEIVANEDRVVIKDSLSKLTIAWIKRHRRTLAKTG
jgi:hypothetical protein